MDWTKRTHDPLNEEVRADVIDYLLAARTPLPKNFHHIGYDDYEGFLMDSVAGKTVLDIGICEHTQERMDSPKWKHRMIKNCAAHVTGVDIIEDLVTRLKSEGYDARLCDATSETDLGERYDVVHVGDVIEHVDSPVNLLKFAARHLKPDGKIIARTPNPYCYSYIWGMLKNGTDKSNLEHMFYVCPTHALEIGRRAGLKLNKYYVENKQGVSKFPLVRLARTALRFVKFGFLPDELFTTIFVYEFVRAKETSENKAA
ncbi:MAG: methyltransferase domain-containing protein [Alphaproteobacteria bacterium]|jgi:SAM-dependent methyltransferase|nr:methyltransferase domain-containing protein [Alphaproteobacteria bacterium]MBP9868548.1 methyltransferase domain-containing protein [Alphaproteobacteria bacterium]